MARVRDGVEVIVNQRTGKPLITWLLTSREQGRTLREIAFDLTDLTGLTISHETVRTWILEG